MIRRLLPLAALVMQIHAVPALAADAAPAPAPAPAGRSDAGRAAAERTMAQNVRVVLPAPPPVQAPPLAPPLRHFSARQR